MSPKCRSGKTIYSAEQLAELVCDESDSDDDFDEDLLSTHMIKYVDDVSIVAPVRKDHVHDDLKK